MDVTVHFRFNKLSGEVEVFEVGQESTLPAAEHDSEHDRVAAEIGALLARFPLVVEVAAGEKAPAEGKSVRGREVVPEAEPDAEAAAPSAPEAEREAAQ
jgi:hypothetical protein